jgi:uncharacterized cupredoxin-like copper-binding protein
MCRSRSVRVVDPPARAVGWPALLIVALVVGWTVGACEAGPPPVTPTPTAGTPQAPRAVNLVARDYSFLPDVLDLIPGETVRLQVVNGGLDVHEAVLGSQAVQDAWAVAEAAAAGAPPGPTPQVSVPPEVAGLRVVVRSGERVDVVWTVPTVGEPLIVGCHIPGHWERGMQIPVRLAAP